VDEDEGDGWEGLWEGGGGGGVVNMLEEEGEGVWGGNGRSRRVWESR
jgi:hypothetical protein